jgi:hypothetical protein
MTTPYSVAFILKRVSMNSNVQPENRDTDPLSARGNFVS